MGRHKVTRPVLALGTFDGVHRGHQTILRAAADLARKLSAPFGVLTFRQPPRLYFTPQAGQTLLTLLEEKCSLLKEAGAEGVQALRFDTHRAHQSAEDFFQSVLRRQWKAVGLVAGYNFGFGRGRAGDSRFLEEQGRLAHIPVVIVPPVCDKDLPISSEQIREHLRRGELDLATRKLGRPYAFSGKVVPGDQRGRQLGYPTANLQVSAAKILPPGVFAVRVRTPDAKSLEGMANIGLRPTIETKGRATVEVHLFDFEGTLYGQTLEVTLVRRLRDEHRFPNLEALQRQLKQDALHARTALQS